MCVCALHYEHVIGHRPLPEFSQETKEAVDHEVKHEMDAVAKIVPTYWPACQFYEEGFYVKEENRDIFRMVSPDGSIRDSHSKMKLAVEIRWPTPGKTFTTCVHYTILQYHICQILSEKSALDCTELLYICYTPPPGSTTCFHATFDEKLWADMHGIH